MANSKIDKIKKIEFLHNIAISRGGKCLSNIYTRNNIKLEWVCAEGHKWFQNSNSIQNGNWCPKCSGRGKSSIEEMQEIAKSRGGKCLSKIYINSRNKLEWECSVGHTWMAKPNGIKRGKWCPDCSSSFGERICRVYFETIFDKKFPKVRPNWLRNSENNHLLELDGYCEELGIAFEHQGRQHYSNIEHFKKTQEELENRIYIDKLKRKLCNQNNIILIEIPEVRSLTKLDDLEQFIFNELLKNEINLHCNRPIKIDWKYVYTPEDTEFLKELKNTAELRGGKLLSTVYLGSASKYLWECKKGHQWEATGSSVKHGRWCAKCSRKEKLSIEEMNKLASDKGGKCLSTIYINGKSKLKWECQYGDVWESTPDSVKNHNSWCPYCAGNAKRTIKNIKIN